MERISVPSITFDEKYNFSLEILIIYRNGCCKKKYLKDEWVSFRIPFKFSCFLPNLLITLVPKKL